MKENTFLDLNTSELASLGGLHTAREITAQPILWQATYKQVLQEKQSLLEFLSPLLMLRDLRIILTGAGSSAFIGEAAQGTVQRETKKNTQAIATTDLITHPEDFLLGDTPTLLISFARSGNSPESVETIHLANAFCKEVYHLVITCNKDGALARQLNRENCYAFILPEDTNDKSLAMTSSFTSMLLAVLLISKINRIEHLQVAVDEIITVAEKLKSGYLQQLKEVATRDFERVVFLGSGPLLGIARECHLKLQELTDGQVICKHDSFLGFRHGPKAVLNEKTLLVFLFSDDDHVLQYERDLALSVEAGARVIPTLSFGKDLPSLSHSLLDIELGIGADGGNELYFITATLIGQILGFYSCLKLGLVPDNPSISGSISRVVQGVNIYSKTDAIY